MGKGLSVSQLSVVRAWQKRDSSRRCSIAQLCREVKAARKTVDDVIKRKRLGRCLRKSGLKLKIKNAVPKFSVRRPFQKKIRVNELRILAPAMSRQWVGKVSAKERKLYGQRRKSYFRKWHRDHPNTGIDHDSCCALLCSQRYW